MPGARASIARRLLGLAGLLYLVLLVASCVVRRVAPTPPPDAAESVVAVCAVDGNRLLERRVRVAYLDTGPPDPGAPVILLVHGSPGEAADFRTVIPALAPRFRVIAPDLPGFGASEHAVPDYSFRAHARYLLELMDALGVRRAHVVGFSMGGGVALSMEDLAGDRVLSVTLLSAIGVQEMELLGDYTLNHAVHALQLGALWGLRELTPQFGALDRFPLDVPYARNFYDSDQRPLRGVLERYAGPMLILHGRHDPLVPVEAAREHARLVPQAQLTITPESHFMVFQEGPRVAEWIGSFVDGVEAGTARTRATAAPVRLAESRRPFDARDLPRFEGVPWLIALLALAAATLVSEDLACVAGGLLVASGRLGFVPAAAACLVGIFAGDLMLFFAGRLLGRAVLRRAPLRWLVDEAQIRASSAWFRERGATVILASRFLPGTRLPTYVTAGILRTSFLRFVLWFGIAALLWTPLLVGAAAAFGTPFVLLFRRFQLWALPSAIASIVAVLVLLRVLPLALTHRGRRRLYGRWLRLTRWEFWPPWAFYPPVVVRIARLGLEHRGLTVFTAANPAIEGGGFIAESKSAILAGLAGATDRIARWTLLPARLGAAEKAEAVGAFLERERLAYPIAIKPDTGQRGTGVAIVRDEAALRARLEAGGGDLIAQEYVGGVEFGVFYVRRPSEPRGRIFSITTKVLPAVTGDGRRTLEELILDDPRAVAMARAYARVNADRLLTVVPAGERVPLVELGTHCRGAIFEDGTHLATPELEAEVDRVSRAFKGFYFGRYDVRSPSVEAFRRGELKVLELNGVTSEATAIYDAGNGLRDAYRTLFAQWALAFEIGAENRARGVRPVGVRDLLRLIVRYRETARTYS